MKIHNTKALPIALLTIAILVVPTASADNTLASGITEALSDSNTDLSFRARYEGVDQDGIDDRADALTVKSRLTIKTGCYNYFSLGLDVDNVSALIADYNSKTNGKTQYPIVADPTGTDVNQGYCRVC